MHRQPTTFRLFLFLLLSLLPGLFVSAATHVATGNAKQAATLQAVAQKIPQKSYIFTNVGTGEKLYYQPTGNHIYPKKGSGSAISIQWHSKAAWLRMSFGKKNKCLSSAWGGKSNGAAVAYACKVGKGGVKGTLEPTKQWWLAVPIDHTTTNKPASNALLLAAQAESINTRNAAVKAAFNSKRLVKRSALERRKKKAKKATKKKAKKVTKKKAKKVTKKAKKTKKTTKKTTTKKSSGKKLGTYYFMPSDHLIDMSARALTSNVVNSRGIKSTQLAVWKKGNKMQQWVLTEA